MKPLFKLLLSLLIKIAFIALIYAIVMGLTGCSRNDRPVLSSFSSENKQEFEVCTEPSREAVVSETSKEAEPSVLKESEQSSESIKETAVSEESSASKPTQSSKKPMSKKVTKAPAKATKKAVTKKTSKAPDNEPEETTTKATTKKVTKAPTKKPTNTPTPKPYTYCTCDAEVSCGSTAAGTFHKFTMKGLTAHKLKSGLWEITDASDEELRAYMRKTYPESANHYGVGKLKNKRDYRYKP